MTRKTGIAGILAVVTAVSVFAGGNKESAGGGEKKIPVKAATTADPRPFTYTDKSGKLIGHNIELVEAVFARLPQYELTFEVTDFPSVFSGLDTDRYQLGVNNFSMNEERKQKYIFSDPTFVNRYIIAVSPDNERFKSLERVNSLADLAGLTTQNTVGTNMATAIQNYNSAHPDAQINQKFAESNILQNLRDVESRRWDFNLLDKPMFDIYAQEYPNDIGKLRGLELGSELSGNLMETPYSYVLIAKTAENEQLAKDFNKALREVVADGTSKKICEKYFGDDYSPQFDD